MNDQIAYLANKLRGKYLLVDTNFLIDASLYREIFREIINLFKENQVALITITPVIAEFLRGSANQTEYEKKLAYLELVLDQPVLPVDETTNELLLDKVIKFYRSRGSKTEMTDLFLASTLLRYTNGLTFLLTSDHKGFPTSLFDIVGMFPVQLEADLRIFCVYGPSEEKSRALEAQFAGVDPRLGT